MCKGKNFIDFPIGNIYKTNKQAGGNVKNLLNKSQRLPAGYSPQTPAFFSQVIHNHIIIILFILYFKFKYDEYNILLKQLIQLCYNTCPVRY